ncbi:hypothetical protein FRC01_005344, partial [Tulasnella sp. 417]
VMTTLLVWDIIITWDREAHYVWKTRWSYAKFIFLFNRYLGPLTFLCLILGWLWVGVSALTGTIVSSILATRLWAIYERDRRVLVALIIGFFVCFAPGWILAFTIGAKYIDPTQLRIYGNVMTYIGGVSMRDGYDARAASIANYAITLGVGFCSNTPAGQGFVSAAFYIGIKSMTCSHIILRLRSYFSLGDPVVDGRPETDPFDRDWKMVGNTTSSSFVSTIIQFAHMITGTTTGTTFNIKSKHLSRREERQTMDLEGAGEGGHEAARRESTQFTFR